MTELFAGGAGLLLLVFIAALGVYWLLFPWFVYTKLAKIAKHLESMEKSQRDMALVQRNFMQDARAWMQVIEPTKE